MIYHTGDININTEKMTFIEALVYSYLTGISFTSTSYSSSTKYGLQYYVYKNRLWRQEANYKAEPIDSCTLKRMKDTYQIYKGDFRPNYIVYKEDFAKLAELKAEIEPLYSKFQEYEKLKDSLKNLGAVDYE